MRHLKGIALVLVMMVTGGCMMNAPDVPAFEDEFTREFMKSTKEVEEGFYLFESKTGGYTIWFPENAVTEPAYYYREGDQRESLSIKELYGDNLIYRARLRYEDSPLTNSIDTQLTLLSSYVNYEGKYEEFQYENNTYYYAKSVFEIDNEPKAYHFFSYIKSNSFEKSVKFIYEVTCYTFEEPCTIDVDLQEEHALKLMKAIEFQE
ncbi:hypothetical protein [Halalkalibacter sp. APA_J-10(15)]|uniref:hypothetical protein n=1 Tax=Halalkalibacter sp. APA_J-10(15) TaxID=2933805 RepID=UPI001FF52EA5|nr:hypothetical protein [Halalkalibacter sp. APA_J-10(15)]MCK0470563.1 hypothetical protein [Halalkalibacter sp. APA_J-10(15)]